MSGAVPSDQKHIVIMELEGPKDEKAYTDFKTALEQLAATHGAKIVIRARGKKW